MNVNVGAADKIVRIVAGLALLSLLVVLQGPSRWIGLVGLVPLLTAFASYCPLYSLFGFNTCPRVRGG